jgi:uncharacterized protein (DUF3820 family)
VIDLDKKSISFFDKEEHRMPSTECGVLIQDVCADIDDGNYLTKIRLEQIVDGEKDSNERVMSMNKLRISRNYRAVKEEKIIEFDLDEIPAIEIGLDKRYLKFFDKEEHQMPSMKCGVLIQDARAQVDNGNYLTKIRIEQVEY